jgi:hypothetical protein
MSVEIKVKPLAYDVRLPRSRTGSKVPSVVARWWEARDGLHLARVDGMLTV